MSRIGKFAPDDLYVFDPVNYNPGDGTLPPVYQDPVIPKNPVVTDDGGAVINPPFRGYFYSGMVRDAYTERPLPGATVTLISGGNLIARQAANANGEFQIDTQEPATQISISEVSHKPFTWPASEVQHTFDLEPDVKTGGDVILPPGVRPKADNTWLWLVGLGLLAKWQKWI